MGGTDLERKSSLVETCWKWCEEIGIAHENSFMRYKTGYILFALGYIQCRGDSMSWMLSW